MAIRAPDGANKGNNGLILSIQGGIMPHTFKTRGTKDSYFQNKGIKGLILPKQGEQRTHLNI